MTVRGFLDRAKDASSFAMRAVPLGASACALFAHADDVPLLGVQETPRCRRRDRP